MQSADRCLSRGCSLAVGVCEATQVTCIHAVFPVTLGQLLLSAGPLTSGHTAARAQAQYLRSQTTRTTLSADDSPDKQPSPSPSPPPSPKSEPSNDEGSSKENVSTPTVTPSDHPATRDKPDKPSVAKPGSDHPNSPSSEKTEPHDPLKTNPIPSPPPPPPRAPTLPPPRPPDIPPEPNPHLRTADPDAASQPRAKVSPAIGISASALCSWRPPVLILMGKADARCAHHG